MAKNLKNLLVYHLHDRAIKNAAIKFAKGRLIDIGCGTKPYQNMLAPYVIEHVGLDREQPFNALAQPDLVGTAYEIPVAEEEFDTALSTGALEHLAEPELALRECFRILKPGGIAIYTAPLIWHVHAAPWDYYRFTSHGLKYLFEKCGFEAVEVKALSGFWVTFGQLFVYYLYRFNQGFMRFIPVIPLVGLLIQAVVYMLDRIDKAEDWTWSYIVIAKKKKDS